MSDDLETRLQLAGAAWRAEQPADAEPRPAPARRWLPAAAAAAAVLVVAGTALAVGDRSPEVDLPVAITSVAEPVEADGGGPPPPTVAPPAPSLGVDPDPQCDPADLRGTAVLDGATGTLTVEGPARRLPDGGSTSARTCRRGPLTAVEVLDGRGSVLGLPVRVARQPDVPNPPDDQSALLLLQEPATAVLRLDGGPCGGAPAALRLTGPATAPLEVPVTGAVPDCREQGSLAVGLLHVEETDGLAVPADRAGLVATAELLEVGTRTRLVLRLANPTRAAISLDPCPDFRLEQVADGAPTRRGASGALPCRLLPDEIAPGSAVQVVKDVFLDPGPVVHRFRWGIAGPASADVVVDRR